LTISDYIYDVHINLSRIPGSTALTVTFWPCNLSASL